MRGRATEGDCGGKDDLGRSGAIAHLTLGVAPPAFECALYEGYARVVLAQSQLRDGTANVDRGWGVNGRLPIHRRAITDLADAIVPPCGANRRSLWVKAGSMRNELGRQAAAGIQSIPQAKGSD